MLNSSKQNHTLTDSYMVPWQSKEKFWNLAQNMLFFMSVSAINNYIATTKT